MSIEGYTETEIMTVAAARQLTGEDTCLVGIGAPSAACNLARLTHAPGIHLIYESGTIGCRPDVLPLSIGDGELCETALTTVSLPEVFRYWLQAGRIDIGFLSGAEMDRYGNLNSTVIGDYRAPAVRLPGAGGAPEIASGCDKTYIIMPMSKRRFVETLSFRTTLGHGIGGDDRSRMGVNTLGPAVVVTDLCVLKPCTVSHELEVVSLHPGVTRERVQEQCGWQMRFSECLVTTDAPTPEELTVLRSLQQRTDAAHAAAS